MQNSGDSALNNSCAKKFSINALDTYLDVINHSSPCEMTPTTRVKLTVSQCQSHNEGRDGVFAFVSSLNIISQLPPQFDLERKWNN